LRTKVCRTLHFSMWYKFNKKRINIQQYIRFLFILV